MSFNVYKLFLNKVDKKKMSVLYFISSIMFHNDLPKMLYHAFVGNIKMFSLVKYSAGLKNKSIILAVNY